MTGTLARFAIFLVLALPAPAVAQESLTLTLDDAVARAVGHAPRLAEATAREAAAAATVTSRGAQEKPSVTVLSGVLRTNHVTPFGFGQPDGTKTIIFPDIPSNYRARAEVTMPLYTSGRVDALVTSARADVSAAAADRQTAAADVALDVAVSYWSLVATRARVSVLTRTLERSDANVADVQARVDAGVLPPSDVLQAQAQRARQRVQLIQAQNDTALAEAQLARLVGVPVGTAIVTATSVDTPTPAAQPLIVRSQAEVLASATTGRPERLALLERQASFRASARAALAGTRPQVAAMAAIEPARPNQRFVPRTDQWKTGWDLGVNVTWSIFDGGRAKADRTAATAQADAVAARVREFDDGVAVETRQRMIDIQSTTAALDASAEAVQAATEARRVLGERFAAGVATATDVLDSDVALLDAELEQTRLRATLRLNEARLLRAVGGQP